MTPDEVIETAIGTLSRLPYLQQHVSAGRIRRSVLATWDEPPAPLIHWLWMAGTDFLGKVPAWDSLASLEVTLAVLQAPDQKPRHQGPARRRQQLPEMPISSASGNVRRP